MEMDGVAMRALLRTVGKIQGLEGKGGSAVEQRQRVLDFLQAGQMAHAGAH